MMRARAGSIIVILVIGLVFGLGLRSLPGIPAASAAGAAAPAAAVAGEGQAPVLVSCGAGQQTLVRQLWLNGQPVSQVECVQGAAARTVVYAGARAQSDQVVYDEVLQPRVVRTQAPVYREAQTRPRRSWQKTALVIGGSTAAGAGVGGAVGGKKGALIGAAIGGGGSTLFEAIKRR